MAPASDQCSLKVILQESLVNENSLSILFAVLSILHAVLDPLFPTA
jgi:hypothetical protein